jgi:hypothetical protein
VTGDRLPAWAFLREFTRSVTRTHLAVVAACVTLILAAQVSTVTSRHGVMVAVTAVSFAATWGLAWWLLGWPPVQRWIRDGSMGGGR